MKNEYLFDLKTPETTWRGSGKHYFSGGEVASEAGKILDAEGPHQLYWVLDTIMHKVPPYIDIDEVHMPHFHVKGYETFFVDSGKVWLFINGQKALAQPGDIVHLQAGQAHGMGFVDEVKWRGTYHDYETYPDGGAVMRVKMKCPELKDDPELAALDPGVMDNTPLERFKFKEVPAEQCLAIKNPSRPWASYEFPGAVMKVIVERWENGGTKELTLCEMQPGFKAEWVKFPKLREVFYVRKGKVRFKIYNDEFIADDECIVNVPKFAPHSIEALEYSEVYDLCAQSYWSLFLQNYDSIRTFDPERFAKPETIAALKQKFQVYVDKISYNP